MTKRKSDLRLYADELGKGLVGELDYTLEAANAAEFMVIFFICRIYSLVFDPILFGSILFWYFMVIIMIISLFNLSYVVDHIPITCIPVEKIVKGQCLKLSWVS